MSGQVNIYLNPQSCDFKDVSLTPHERIGSLYHRLVTLARASKKKDNSPEINQLLKVLGVHEKDKKAQDFFSEFFYQLNTGKVTVIPSSETEGMYFLEVDGEKKWVFKPGEKRAYIETLVRRVALLAGLEAHIPEGIYCSLKLPGTYDEVSASASDSESIADSESEESDEEDNWNKPSVYNPDLFSSSSFGTGGAFSVGGFSFSHPLTVAVPAPSEASEESEEEEEPILTELFNGLVKQIYPNATQDGFSTGILERFEGEETDLSDPVKVANMALLMAMIGLRDTSRDNITGEGILIDAEDSFPVPNGGQLDDTALFQLEFLVDGGVENPVLYQKIEAKDLTFNKLKPTTLMRLMSEDILFFDAVAERDLKAILVCEKTGEEEAIIIETDEEGKLSFKSENEKFKDVIKQMTDGSTEYIPEGWHFAVSGTDSGGNRVVIEIPAKHKISGYVSYLDRELQRLVMPSSIIDGVIERTGRLRDFLDVHKDEGISVLDLFKVADRPFKWQAELSPEHFKRSLTKTDFLNMFPDDRDQAEAAFERYRRAPTPLNAIGKGPPRGFGLMSPPLLMGQGAEPKVHPTLLRRDSLKVSPVHLSGAGLDDSETEGGSASDNQ